MYLFEIRRRPNVAYLKRDSKSQTKRDYAECEAPIYSVSHHLQFACSIIYLGYYLLSYGLCCHVGVHFVIKKKCTKFLSPHREERIQRRKRRKIKKQNQLMGRVGRSKRDSRRRFRIVSKKQQVQKQGEENKKQRTKSRPRSIQFSIEIILLFHDEFTHTVALLVISYQYYCQSFELFIRLGYVIFLLYGTHRIVLYYSGTKISDCMYVLYSHFKLYKLKCLKLRIKMEFYSLLHNF